MSRFRQLREIKGGKKRAAQFFRENIGKKVNRKVLQSLLHDQKDYMKRIRGNGGARDELRKERIEILTGVYDSKKAMRRGITLEADEVISLEIMSK